MQGHSRKENKSYMLPGHLHFVLWTFSVYVPLPVLCIKGEGIATFFIWFHVTQLSFYVVLDENRGAFLTSPTLEQSRPASNIVIHITFRMKIKKCNCKTNENWQAKM